MGDLIDGFARAALYGMLAHPTRYKPRHSECHLHWHAAIASEAYDIADAMMEQLRNRKQMAMLELLIQAGYDTSLPHPECFKDFSYVKLAETLKIPIT